MASACFGAGMGLVVCLTHALCGQVRVNLRCRERTVSQKFLHGAEIRPVVEQMCGERMSERVGADIRIQAGAVEVLADLAPHGSC